VANCQLVAEICYSGDLHWRPAPSTEAEAQSMETSTNTPKKTLRGAWDAEIYKEQNEHVQGTLSSGTRVLGLHVYSDSTVMSSSGAVSAYPLRMRVINITTKEVRWVTLAYIPQVETKFLDTRKGHEVRAELLQRILHMVCRTSVRASHNGALINLPGGGRKRVSARALL